MTTWRSRVRGLAGAVAAGCGYLAEAVQAGTRTALGLTVTPDGHHRVWELN